MSLGFFLIPEQTYACSSKKMQSKESACKKMPAGKYKAKSSCCKGDKHKKDCSGKCKNGLCQCAPGSSVSITVATVSDLQKRFAEFQKQTFGYKPAYYSSGYSSIWLPPKIS